MFTKHSAILIFFLVMVLLASLLTVSCSNHCPEDMDVSGTLTVINEEGQADSGTVPAESGTNPTENGTKSAASETILDYNEPVVAPGSQVPAASSGTIMYAIEVHFTVISNIAVNVTSDEAGEVVFHTLYWGNVARGGDILTFSFWVHNIGEQITFHTEVTGDYLTLTPPLDVTLAPGESQQFNMTLNVPYEAPEGDQDYTIELVEGSYM